MSRIKFWILFILLSGVNCSNSYIPLSGDLLFQDLDCGETCNAIEAVTQGIKGANFSHTGLLINSNDQWVVLEAISAGVVMTPLNDFLSRSSDSTGAPKVIVGRLKEEYSSLIPIVLEQTEYYLGKHYDNVFRMDSNSYYCSEMIYEMFKSANRGIEVFKLSPMTFKIPGSDEFFPQWVEYYKELGEEIPEGEPGINPGSISRSDAIEIVYIYGNPDGWQVQ
ncbi:MAG: hypothetical protein JW894_07910 [Bacteroidales bacterium]|nr:hypothetical protein [Bacteroidales bacterium]